MLRYFQKIHLKILPYNFNNNVCEDVSGSFVERSNYLCITCIHNDIKINAQVYAYIF